MIAAVLAATMVLALAGCDEEGGGSGTTNNGGNVTSNNATGGDTPGGNTGGDTDASVESAPKKDFSDSATEEAAKNAVDQLKNKDLEINERLKWLSWFPIDETSPACILFKEAYGAPEKGSDPEYEGCVFETISCTWNNRLIDLGAKIAADDSPDLFPFLSEDFPYGVLLGRYQPLDDIIDVNDARWGNAKDIMEQYVVNNKHYCAFTSVSVTWLMWYRKSCIEAAGLDDPQELFMQDKWDWNTFLAMGRAWKATGPSDINDPDAKFVTDGYNTGEGFVVTTGVPQVGSKDGKIVSNYYTPEFERVMTNLVEVMHNEVLRYPYEEINNWSPSSKSWASGNTLFWCNGAWEYESLLQKFRTKYKWPEDEIKVVPYPKDPSADKYYTMVAPDAQMWVKGSTNKNGVQAWLDCNLVCSTDPSITAAAKEKSLVNPETGYTREIIDFLYDQIYSLDGKMNFVVEHKGGLGPTIYGQGYTEDPAFAIVMLPWCKGDSWTQLREEHKGTFEAAINEINNRLE